MKPQLAVIDYGMGNLRSVAKAFEHEGAQVQIIRSPEEIGSAQALILPGVGAVGDCIDGLKATGLDDTIRAWIAEDRPFFGICLGLQALFEHSEEGNVKGLGIFPGKVVRFQVEPPLKVPHMGWNTVSFRHHAAPNSSLPLDGASFYFVHSYYVQPSEEALIWCEAEHGEKFTSGIQSGRCFATQFHPEKSQAQGLKVYRAFIDSMNS